MGFLYTCARPGRSLGRKQAQISDAVVDAWVAGIAKEIQFRPTGMPCSSDKVVIISLLGRKPSGLSEFSYYSFRGGFDLPKDRPGCPTWQEWLTAKYGPRYRVHEFPTEDLKIIPEETKELLVNAVQKFLHAGQTVILVDSGGVGRTGSIVQAVLTALRAGSLVYRP